MSVYYFSSARLPKAADTLAREFLKHKVLINNQLKDYVLKLKNNQNASFNSSLDTSEKFCNIFSMTTIMEEGWLSGRLCGEWAKNTQ